MLRVEDLWVALDDVMILKGIDLQLQPGEIFCLLGPSGCGKSTLLRTIAGLERPNLGSIIFDGTDITTIPASRRGFGLMFQDYALFPHMNVIENVSFGLRMARHSRNSITTRAEEVLSLVGMSGLGNRDINTLSGGQKQRVALARSLAPNPRLLMLDEPMASLDVAFSRKLIDDIRQIIKRLGLSTIYVTHNQKEAFSIGDRVAIMNEGQIIQVSPAEDLYLHPDTEFVARFLGFQNFIPIQHFDENGQAVTSVGLFDVAPGSQSIFIHPDAIEVVSQHTSETVEGTVVQRVFEGQYYHVQIALEMDCELAIWISTNFGSTPQVGDHIALQIKANHVYGF